VVRQNQLANHGLQLPADLIAQEQNLRQGYTSGLPDSQVGL
jgi:hypothetical protein